MKNLNKCTKQQLIDEINCLNDEIEKFKDVNNFTSAIENRNKQIESLVDATKARDENIIKLNHKINNYETQLANITERYNALLKATSNEMVYKSSNNTSTIAMWSIILNVVLFIVALIAIII